MSVMLTADGKLITLTIPYPGPTPRQRGIHAVSKSNAKLHIDFTLDELNEISQAAAIAGLTKSEYIRWVGRYAAREIINAQVRTEPVSTE